MVTIWPRHTYRSMAIDTYHQVFPHCEHYGCTMIATHDLRVVPREPQPCPSKEEEFDIQGRTPDLFYIQGQRR
jgi:hypothetical protein